MIYYNVKEKLKGIFKWELEKKLKHRYLVNYLQGRRRTQKLISVVLKC